MKTKLYKSVLAVLFATSLLAGATATQAGTWCRNGYCHHTRVHHCRYVPGHRGPNGGWVHAHRVCR